MEDAGLIIFCVIIIACSFLTGIKVGIDHGKEKAQIEAIKHNAAQFIIKNKETGETKFLWNDEIPYGPIYQEQK